jgi:hypothetical protein
MFNITLSIIYHNQITKKVSETNQDFDFDSSEDYMQFRREFYREKFERGFKRYERSANQLIKLGVVLTPYFIPR